MREGRGGGEGGSQAQDHGQATYAKIRYSVLSTFATGCSKLFSIMKYHLPSAYSYADDTQLYLSFRPLKSTCEAEALDTVEKCFADVRSWMINDSGAPRARSARERSPIAK